MRFTPEDVVVALAVIAACVTDLRSQKIPNVLTYSVILVGLALAAVQGRPVDALIGVGAAFALHFLLFALGVDRAGDAKLMMGVGALWGWLEMVEATLWTFLVFIPIGLVVLVARGRLGNFVAALKWSGRRVFRSGDPGPRPEGTLLAKAPSILVGVAIARFTQLIVLGG